MNHYAREVHIEQHTAMMEIFKALGRPRCISMEEVLKFSICNNAIHEADNTQVFQNDSTICFAPKFALNSYVFEFRIDDLGHHILSPNGTLEVYDMKLGQLTLTAIADILV